MVSVGCKRFSGEKSIYLLFTLRKRCFLSETASTIFMTFEMQGISVVKNQLSLISFKINNEQISVIQIHPGIVNRFEVHQNPSKIVLIKVIEFDRGHFILTSYLPFSISIDY